MALEVQIQKKFDTFCLDVAFTAPNGTLGILGASGCGKSLTLRCIAGILRPDKGRILLNNTVLFDSQQGIDLPPQKRRVGFLFQNYALFPNMTVQQNIQAVLPSHYNKAMRQQQTAQLIAAFHLNGLERHRPYQLSGGQQQRVALARMLAAQPNATLLDEPFSALDANLREGLQLELQSTLARFGGPAILVSHDRDEIYRLCENTVVMEQGKVVACGNTKELFHSPKSVTAAKLTGCKNILSAKKQGDHSIFLPDWNHTLQTRWVVPDGLMGIGIRAHDFSPNGQENPIPVELTQQMEDPFFFTFRFSVNNCSLPLWWKVSKHTLSSEKPMLPNTLYLDSDAILPLCQP